MRLALVLAIALGLARATTAQEVGPGDVIPPALQSEIGLCLQQNRTGPVGDLACFDRPGVTRGARDLAAALIFRDVGSTPALLVGFQEAGAMDVAEIFIPTLANTNYQFALVNGPEGPRLATELNFRRTAPRDPSVTAILRRHPTAFESGRVSIAVVRALPGGVQRFVFTDIVTDGCRACAPVATSVNYIDLGPGTYGFQHVGWLPLTDRNAAQSARLLRAADVASLQRQLNLMGYGAGPVDGAAGPRTMEALRSFQREHCLPESNRMSDPLVRALAPEEVSYAPAPCGPGAGRSPVELPFPDGVYATDVLWCPPMSDATFARLIEAGEEIFLHTTTVRDGEWSWGESTCDITRATPEGRGLSLEMDCLAEGHPQRSTVLLQQVDGSGFAGPAGQRFELCAPSAAVLPLADGVYAHDRRLCPGYSGAVPDNVAVAAGVRPLTIDGGTLSWDHASCDIDAVRQAGRDLAADLSCISENIRVQTTEVVTMLSETSVFFDGFERQLCAPVDAPPVAHSANATLPVDLVEGVYATDPAGCPTFDGSARGADADQAAVSRVVLRDGVFSQAGQTCPIDTFDVVNGTPHLIMDCLYGETPVSYLFEMVPDGRESFRRNDQTFRLCRADATPAATPSAPIFPVPSGWISANYGAHGEGPDSDPDAYFAGRFHAATDIAAVVGTPVLAPVSGDLIYYRQGITAAAAPDPVQTFAVLRDREGRDWILAHMTCTICPEGPLVGDVDTYDEARWVRNIQAGTQIGLVMDYPPRGSPRGDHLHLGLVTGPIVEDGRLLPAYHRSRWALVVYEDGEPGAVDVAAATARGLGFIDPMDVLPAP